MWGIVLIIVGIVAEVVDTKISTQTLIVVKSEDNKSTIKLETLDTLETRTIIPLDTPMT